MTYEHPTERLRHAVEFDTPETACGITIGALSRLIAAWRDGADAPKGRPCEDCLDAAI